MLSFQGSRTSKCINRVNSTEKCRFSSYLLSFTISFQCWIRIFFSIMLDPISLLLFWVEMEMKNFSSNNGHFHSFLFFFVLLTFGAVRGNGIVADCLSALSCEQARGFNPGKQTWVQLILLLLPGATAWTFKD